MQAWSLALGVGQLRLTRPPAREAAKTPLEETTPAIRECVTRFALSPIMFVSTRNGERERSTVVCLTVALICTPLFPHSQSHCCTGSRVAQVLAVNRWFVSVENGICVFDNSCATFPLELVTVATATASFVSICSFRQM